MSEAPLPAAVNRYLEARLVEEHQPGWAFIDGTGALADWGGAMARYADAPPQKGMAASDQFNFLAGLLPLQDEAVRVPQLMLADGCHADLHLVPSDGGGTWMLLLDATDAARREGMLQQQANDLELMRARQRRLLERLEEKNVFEHMVGRSEPMCRIFQLIRDVARVHATVLIEGETGTGKELAARAVHTSSPRKDGPFIVVNCAGFTDSLINSQLFGHRKGAFTDAVANQKGVFEAAHGGSILLDEIGDIPMNTQTRILRALEQREIIRVGETEARRVDIRILAATNKDLEEEVRRGNFRLDLLYRIRVARIRLPALRERREDIPLLARAFAAAVAAENGMETPMIGRETLATLLDYRWPGNVRELRNAMEFALIHCRDGVVRHDDLPAEILTDVAPQVPSAPASGKIRLAEALQACGGRRGEAAKQMGISRATLYRRMKAFGMEGETGHGDETEGRNA